jgi:hypothetical protein
MGGWILPLTLAVALSPRRAIEADLGVRVNEGDGV